MFVALSIVNSCLIGGAFLSMRSAFSGQLAEKAYSCDWFTNNQLNWVSYFDSNWNKTLTKN